MTNELKSLNAIGLFKTTEFGKKYHPFEIETIPIIIRGKKAENNTPNAINPFFL
jgi:hypothetical protein